MGETRAILPGALSAVCVAILARAGMHGADARLVADSLVQADLWGHQSHGVLRLSWYMAKLRSGAISVNAQPEVMHRRGATALIDANNAMGQVAAARAAAKVIELVGLHGVGAVSVRNSNHFGTAMYFALMAVRAGCIGFVTTNASPAIAPWGGREKVLGNNPWCWAAPAGQHPPMVLDIANTTVARGKIALARQEGRPIPPGWALNSEGNPTTDANEAFRGLIAPMGGHKGYGISVMMDMLAGVLSGSGFATEVRGPYEPAQPGRVGHFLIALEIEAFMPLRDFESRQERLIAKLKAAARSAGVDEIFYPGEFEARQAERQQNDGILLPDKTVADLRNLCAQAELDWSSFVQ